VVHAERNTTDTIGALIPVLAMAGGQLAAKTEPESGGEVVVVKVGKGEVQRCCKGRAGCWTRCAAKAATLGS
jgi:hypothetical protein